MIKHLQFMTHCKRNRLFRIWQSVREDRDILLTVWKKWRFKYIYIYIVTVKYSTNMTKRVTIPLTSNHSTQKWTKTYAYGNPWCQMWEQSVGVKQLWTDCNLVWETAWWSQNIFVSVICKTLVEAKILA